jgi:hypothetical protein
MSEHAIDIHTTAAGEKPPIAGGQPKSALMKVGERGVQLSTVEEMLIFAKAVVDSGLAPYSFKTPQAVMVAIQYGAELGLPPMAALQNIAVINGRPTVWGDAVPGIGNASGLIEDYKQEEVGEPGKDSWGYRVTITRKGRSQPIVSTYTVAHAKTAKLWGKTGRDGQPTPWITSPDRMLLNRARTFAYRDAVPEKMRGIVTAEEARDIPPERNVTHSLDDIDEPKTE